MPEGEPTPGGTGFIDGHVHFWDTAVFDLPWLTAAPHLARAYSPADLSAVAASSPPESVIAVQAGQSRTEARWLLAQARGAADVVSGVVLQFAFEPQRWAGAVTPHVVEGAGGSPAGIRVPVHRLAADWDSLDGLEELAAGLASRGVVLEVLLRPDQLEGAERLASRHPSLTIVLCHLGLGANDPDAAWVHALRRLGGRPNAAAKVSGIFTARGAPERARRAVSTALECFGADRLLFGSDWPMSERAGAYRQIVERTATALGALSAEEERAVWRETAIRLYGLAAAS